MNAILSYLPITEEKRIQQIWLEATYRCQMEADTFPPQLVYQVANGYEVKGLQGALERVIPQQASFCIHCCGVGMTEVRSPRFYIPIVKSYPLVQLQQTIWEVTRSIRMGICPTYQPDEWMPRIYFPFVRVTPDQASKLYKELKRVMTQDYIPIQQVSWVSSKATGMGQKRHFSFLS
ncbi:hypothetical protein [Thermoactinomyces sp. DSM 45892]|uniref:hypothetical protein n=1 Tax=Thermoactinomyces sp. DSM 45892 TaxID=1882753 RepID=UPI00089598D3|nr:hypothetical protein [Thermoactinomyces sp. DSM 45892]SDY28577.1 hypothetical protein SAMN05444416_103179 [Thermoactinomyces sp. DSM 45892]